MLNLTKTPGFYRILTQTYSESNSNDHLHTELVQMIFNMGKEFRVLTIWRLFFQFNELWHRETQVSNSTA